MSRLIALALALSGCASSGTPILAREGDDSGECIDGADNDIDGRFDCDDEDCAGAPACDLADADADIDADADTDADLDGPTDDAAGAGDDVQTWASPGENGDGDCVGEATSMHDSPWVSQKLVEFTSWTGNMCCGPAVVTSVAAEVSDGVATEDDLKVTIDTIDAEYDDWASRGYLCDTGGTNSDRMVEIFDTQLGLEAEAITTDWCSLKDLVGPHTVVIIHADSQGGNSSSTFRAGASHWLIFRGSDGTFAYLGDPGRSTADQGDNRAYTEASVRARYEARGTLAIVVDLTGGCPADYDGDGYGVGDDCRGTDCNDGAVTVHPDAIETCDNVDQNCNGMSDEPSQTYYADADSDGYGTSSSQRLCTPASPYSATQSGDCNDGNATVHPDAQEACDGVDSNCNGPGDEQPSTWYRDGDGDGWGTSSSTTSCAATPPYTATKSGDCDDAVGAVHPGGAEVCGNGRDDDCSAGDLACPPSCMDADADGYGTGSGCLGADCNDNAATAHPGATELANYADDDCDSQVDDGVRVRLSRMSWSNGLGCLNVSADFDHCYAATGTTCAGSGQGGGNGYVGDGNDLYVYPASLGNGAATITVGGNLLAGLASCYHAGVHEHWYGTVDGTTYANLRTTPGWTCSAVIGYVRTGSVLPGSVAYYASYNPSPLSDRLFGTVSGEAASCSYGDGGTAWWAWTR